MKLDDIRVVTLGPGSQPQEQDGQMLDYMALPDSMQTYSPPPLPEPERLNALTAGRDWLQRLHEVLAEYRVGPSLTAASLSLDRLDSANRTLVDQVLGEGEVSVLCRPPEAGVNTPTYQVQEAVFAGVWRVRVQATGGALIHDTVEVGPIPSCVLNNAAAINQIAPAEPPPGVMNAPALLTELGDKVASFAAGDPPHVVNLTLLPQTPEDLSYLEQTLGLGPVTILSRGYGNCRITATAVRNLWWVQYYNSNDALILNTLEVSPVPQVACAAQEDIDDSAERLAEILQEAEL